MRGGECGGGRVMGCAEGICVGWCGVSCVVYRVADLLQVCFRSPLFTRLGVGSVRYIT